MRVIARIIAASAIGVVASASVSQVTIGPNGIRSGNTVIDGSGVHTNGTDVTSHGVRTSTGAGTIIRTNGGHRSIDCAGGALTVNGNSNHFTVSDCAAVTLNGNGNAIDASFARDGRLELIGNHNTIRWTATDHARVGVSNLGSKNVVTHR